MMNRSYSELITLPAFEDRFEYLALNGGVGIDTFGWDRYLNQKLYHDPFWKAFRRDIIIRDNGLDLGVDGYDIVGSITVHHINPITPEDILRKRPCVFDPNNVISTSDRTHKAIHYGNYKSIKRDDWSPRQPHDTTLWRKTNGREKTF